MEANTISNQVEEEDSTTCPDGGMTKSKDKEENMMPKKPCPKDAMVDDEEPSMEPVTQRT